MCAVAPEPQAWREASPPSVWHAARRQQGMTLVELLVALAIFALISVICFRGLSQTMAAEQRVSADMQTWQTMDALFLRLQSDLETAVPTGFVTAQSERWPAFAGGEKLPGPEEVQLRWVREQAQIVDGSGGARVQAVAYRLRQGRLDWLVWQPQAAAPVVYPLLSGVEKFEASFLDDEGVWRPYWPYGRAVLPRALKISLTMQQTPAVERVWRIN